MLAYYAILFILKFDLKRSRKMTKDQGIDTAFCNSAAGVHSETATAFKILKNAKQEKRDRRCCTVIYDSLSVLEHRRRSQKLRSLSSIYLLQN